MSRPAPDPVGVLLGVVCLLVVGCTLERRHRILTFFFDGVPPLQERGGDVEEDREVLPPSQASEPAPLPLVPHKPYGMKECDRCHPKNVLMILNRGREPGFCFQCHEHKAHQIRFASYTYLHGPVVVDGCLDCHNPHASRYAGLTLAPDPTLCYRCHSRNAMLELPGHRKWPGETCLRCHDPHGGTARYFLRAGDEP